MTHDTPAIRRDIERTRSEMSATIDEIQGRLRPSHLAEDAKEAARDAAAGLVESAREAVRDATIGKAERMVSDVKYRANDTKTSLADTIRDNPLPAAIAAASIGWLFMNRSSRSGMSYGRDGGIARSAGQAVGAATDRAGEMAEMVGERASDVGGGVWDTVSRNPVPAALMAIGAGWLWRSMSGDGARGWSGIDGYSASGAYHAGYGYSAEAERSGPMERVGEVASKVVDRAQEVGSAATERVEEVGSVATERVQEVGSAATERVQDLSRQAQWRTRQARGQVDTLMTENPLAMGALAVGLGAAVGLALPGTEPERRMMGDARERLLDRAQETMQETQEKIKQVAEKAGEAAKTEAMAQDITR
jgi:ElaB/YqjD/DUF883 family membrane-anchored ribosome-binding protein